MKRPCLTKIVHKTHRSAKRRSPLPSARNTAIVFLCGWVAILSVQAQTAPVNSIEDRCIRVLAPSANSIAMGETQQRLAVGFSSGSPSPLWLLKLDGKGSTTSEPPAALELPVATTPGGMSGYPVALIFHPRLPLLYVWRHATVSGKPGNTAGAFDHLVVFNLANPTNVEVAVTTGSGERFAADVFPATLTIDPAGRRLFVSNLRIRPPQGALRVAVGYFPLDTAGMPLMENDQPQVNHVDITDFQPLPIGRGFLAVNAQVLLMAVQNGVLTWDIADRRAGLSRVLLPGLPVPSGFLGGDTDWFYWAAEGTGALRAMRHTDGYPTLLPEAYIVEKAAFRSPPIRMFGKQPGLAIGGDQQLHWIGLNAEGSFNKTDHPIPIPGTGKISLMAYSKVYDRLYIPVEKEP